MYDFELVLIKIFKMNGIKKMIQENSRNVTRTYYRFCEYPKNM